MQEKKFLSVNFSQNFEDLLNKRRLTQRAVAAGAGLSPASINQYLSGRIPKSEELYKLALFFGVSMEYLLTGHEDAPKNLSAEQEWRDRALASEAKVTLLKSGLQGLLKKI